MRNALFGEVLCAVVFLAICAVEFASKWSVVTHIRKISKSTGSRVPT